MCGAVFHSSTSAHLSPPSNLPPPVQCRSLRMVIDGKEKVPMQVDGEAWLQDPGVIEVTHKNKARMIVKDKVSPRMLVDDPVRRWGINR